MKWLVRDHIVLSLRLGICSGPTLEDHKSEAPGQGLVSLWLVVPQVILTQSCQELPHPPTPNGAEAEPGPEWEAPALSCPLPTEIGTGVQPEGTAGLGGGVRRPWRWAGSPVAGRPLTSPEASTLESATCTSSSVMSKSKSFSQSSLMSVLEPGTRSTV